MTTKITKYQTKYIPAIFIVERVSVIDLRKMNYEQTHTARCSLVISSSRQIQLKNSQTKEKNKTKGPGIVVVSIHWLYTGNVLLRIFHIN